MKHIISIDDDAHKILNQIKKELHGKGRASANYSETIRYMYSLRNEPQ